MTETNLMHKIMLSVSTLPGIRIFRNNVGVARYGEYCKKCKFATQWVKYGLFEGSSDLIGWKTIQVTPDMVGKNIAVFTAIEIKTKSGSPTKEQINFIEVVKKSGGISGIVRDEKEALLLLK